MKENDKPVIVYTTCPSLEWAEKIGSALVESRQAACANIIPRAISIYAWENEIQRDDEVVIIIKTLMGLSTAVIETINKLHPYDLPAALVLPVDGSQEFITWIAEQTDSHGQS